MAENEYIIKSKYTWLIARCSIPQTPTKNVIKWFVDTEVDDNCWKNICVFDTEIEARSFAFAN